MTNLVQRLRDWPTSKSPVTVHRERLEAAEVIPALVEALEGLVAVAERNIYPQPDKPDSDWAKLEAARTALAGARP